MNQSSHPGLDLFDISFAATRDPVMTRTKNIEITQLAKTRPAAESQGLGLGGGLLGNPLFGSLELIPVVINRPFTIHQSCSLAGG